MKLIFQLMFSMKKYFAIIPCKIYNWLLKLIQDIFLLINKLSTVDKFKMSRKKCHAFEGNSVCLNKYLKTIAVF